MATGFQPREPSSDAASDGRAWLSFLSVDRVVEMAELEHHGEPAVEPLVDAGDNERARVERRGPARA